MKQVILFLILPIFCFSCKNKTLKEHELSSKKAISLSVEEKESKYEWISLFDGKSLKGWHGFNKKGISPEWSIQDEVLVFTPNSKKKESNDLISNEEFTNFELSIEWKISKEGNSGIFWGVKEGAKYNVPYITGPEIQILDNKGHPDSKDKRHQTGALYDMVAPSQDVTNPPGTWNHFVISINHKINKGFVKLNNTEISSFPVHGPQWKSMIKNSKFGKNNWNDFGVFETGKLGLQDHGNFVFYKNIKIRKL